MGIFSHLKDAATGKTYKTNVLLGDNLGRAVERLEGSAVHPVVRDLGKASGTAATAVLQSLYFEKWDKFQNPYNARLSELTPERSLACMRVLVGYYIRLFLVKEANFEEHLRLLGLTVESLYGQILATYGGGKRDTDAAIFLWSYAEQPRFIGNTAQVWLRFNMRLHGWLMSAALGDGSPILEPDPQTLQVILVIAQLAGAMWDEVARPYMQRSAVQR
jgi:hypothetical protein